MVVSQVISCNRDWRLLMDVPDEEDDNDDVLDEKTGVVAGSTPSRGDERYSPPPKDPNASSKESEEDP